MHDKAFAVVGGCSLVVLPILEDGKVSAGINMYASTFDAFDEHHEGLAEARGAWVDRAITNADMGFTTRVQAAETLGLLQTENLIDQAVGALMADRDIPSDEAHQKAQTSAQRAGISDAQMARAILSLLATAPNKERD